MLNGMTTGINGKTGSKVIAIALLAALPLLGGIENAAAQTSSQQPKTQESVLTAHAARVAASGPGTPGIAVHLQEEMKSRPPRSAACFVAPKETAQRAGVGTANGDGTRSGLFRRPSI